MSFNYPTGSVFSFHNGYYYYTYIGYDKNEYIYKFMLTDRYREEVNIVKKRKQKYSKEIDYEQIHSKQWTECAIENKFLIPLFIMPKTLLVDICECMKNIKILSKISVLYKIPDDIENLIKNYLGFYYLCNYIPKKIY